MPDDASRRDSPLTATMNPIRTCWRGAFLAAYAVMLLIGCSRQANLQGDVFVTGESGTVTRGADLLVMVLPATSAFEQERKALEEAFQAALVGPEAETLRREYEEQQRVATGLYRLIDPVSSARASIAWDYQAKARELFKKHTRHTTRTDVNGHFEFKALDRGKIYLYAETTFRSRRPLPRGHFVWLVPVDLQEPQQKMDLSGSNAGWVFASYGG